jgi:hypothetical protein
LDPGEELHPQNMESSARITGGTGCNPYLQRGRRKLMQIPEVFFELFVKL